MTKYAKIIDCGESFSTGHRAVNGIPANKTEWAKHNFYPQNGMVGEIIEIQGSTVLKISEGIYVEITRSGIQEISYNEFLEGKKNNVCTGMNERQRRINEQMDALIAMFRNFSNK